MMFMRGWTRTSDEEAEAEAEQIVAGAVGPQQQQRQQQSRRRQRPQASSSQSPPPTHQRYDSLGDMSDLTSEGIAHLQMQMPSNSYHLRSARSPAASPPASASASVLSPAACSSQASATPPAPAPSPAPASSPPQPEKEKEGGTAPSPAAQKRLLARLDAAEVAAAQLTDTSLTEEYSQSSEWSTSAGSPATTPDRSRLLRRGGSANSGSGRSSASSSPAQDSIGFAYADDIYAYTDDGAASLSAGSGSGSGSGSLDGAAALPLPSSFAAHPAAATPARPAAARSPARTRAKAVSPSPPRHAVEFRRRAHPAARGPVPPLRQAWSFDQATPTRQRYYYETDGRTLGGTVLDVEDPYLSSGSEGAARAAAEEVWRPRMDMQVDMDEDVDAGGGDREAGWRDLRRRSPARHVYGYVGDGDGDCAPILTPTTSATPSKLRRAPGFDLHPPARGAGSLSVARILRAILVLGAAGGAANLLRAHLLLADLYLPAGSAKAASAAAGRGPYSQSPAAPRPPPRLRGGSATVTRVRTAAGGSALLLPFRPPASAPPAAARMFGVAGPVSGSGSHYAEELREERTAMAGAMKAAAGFDGRGTEAPPPTYSARILPTPGRADLTDAAVARLAACPRGAEVRVGREGDGDWSSTSSWRAAGTAGRPTTDAVLLLGDDLALTCEELDRGECDNLPLVFSFLLLRLMIRFHCVA